MSMAPAGPPVRVPIGGLLTPRMERLIRIGSVGSAVVIATCAMVLSYSGLLDLALDAQVHPRLALLVPIMVDGLQFVGSLGVVYSTLSGLRSWYPWILMLMGVTISAWGNWQAAPDDLTAKLLHASAPIILALVLEELLRVMRHKVHLHNAAWLAQQEASEAPEVAEGAEGAESPAEALPGSLSSTVSPAATAPDVTGAVAQASETAVSTAVEDLASMVVEPAPEPHVARPTATPPAAVVAGADPVVEPEPVVVATRQVDTDPVVEPETFRGPGSGPTWTPREPILPVRRDPEPVAHPTGERPPVVAEQATPSVSPDPTLPFGGEDDEEETLPPYSESGTLKEQVREILIAEPEIPAAKIARVMRRDASYMRRIVREVKAELDEEAAASTQATAPAPAPAPASGPASGPVPAPVPAPAPSPVPSAVSEPTVPEPTPAAPVAPVVAAAQTEPSLDDLDDLDDVDAFASPTYAVR